MKVPQPKKYGNVWFCQVQVNGVRHYIQDEDKQVCVAKAMELKAGLATRSSKHKTLTQAIDNYIAERSNVLSASSIRGYRIIQRNRFKELMLMPCDTINQSVLQKAVNKESKLVATKTLKNAIGFVQTVLAYESGVRTVVHTPQVVIHEHPWLTPEQVPVFIEAIKGTDIELPCLLGLWSMRSSEIFGLRWMDCDLKNRIIRVDGATVPNEHNEFIRQEQNKNKTSRRTIPMCDRLYDLIQGEIKNFPSDQAICTMHPQTLRRRINKLCEDNNLPSIGIHGLRHSFISMGYATGVPAEVLQEIGGWSKDSAVIRTRYLHISQADKTRYTDELLKMFG